MAWGRSWELSGPFSAYFYCLMTSLVAFQWERGIREAIEWSWWIGRREHVLSMRLSRCIEQVVGRW